MMNYLKWFLYACLILHISMGEGLVGTKNEIVTRTRPKGLFGD